MATKLKVKQYRCDRCNLFTMDDTLRLVHTEWVCQPCRVRWYVLMVEPKKEKTTAANVRRTALIEDREEEVKQVFVPTHKVRKSAKDGTVKVYSEVSFEGYILLQMEYTPDLFHMLKGVEGVYGLLPDHENPTPIATQEAAVLLLRAKQIEEDAMPAEVVLPYKAGAAVTINDGIWKGHTATVVQITGSKSDPDVAVDVTMFGRPVRVVCKHWQVTC